jgi:hypothetical protein
MLFAVKYEPRMNRTAEDRRRIRRLLMAWHPPSSVKLVAHYHYVSGGGVLVMETEAAIALFESLEPFKPMLQFDVEPVVNVIEALAASMDVDEWVASVKDDEPL